jgi:hypothetical protein
VTQQRHDEPTPAPPAPASRVDARRVEIRELVTQGLTAVEPEERLRLFERAHRLDFNDPWAMSYHGWALASVRKGTLQGIVFCEEAVRRMGPNPDLLLNLAEAYLAASNKREAVRALRRAMANTPDEDRAVKLLMALGLRRRPIFPFLPRSFFLNKWLGRLRHRVLSRGEKPDDGRQPIPAELGTHSLPPAQAQQALGRAAGAASPGSGEKGGGPAGRS